MKKKLAITLIPLVLLTAIVLGILFFIPRTDVFLGEYTVSEDGREIQMEVGVAGSFGYIGRYSVKQKGNGLHITFYSSLWGTNTISGGNLMKLNLKPDCDSIYFNDDNKEGKLMLSKNQDSGEWERYREE